MASIVKKRIILIHGWGGKPHGGFRLWLKKELEKNGYEVEIPQMPNTDNPVKEEWLGKLDELIPNPDENITLVGHSLGGSLVLHYLDKLPEGKKIGKAVMVAGVVDKISGLSDTEENFIKPWLQLPNFKKIKKSTNGIVALFSDNDRWIPLESEKIMKDCCGAKTIIEHNMGHYSEDDGLLEASSVLNAILAE